MSLRTLLSTVLGSFILYGCASQPLVRHNFPSPVLQATSYEQVDPSPRPLELSKLDIEVSLSTGFAHTTLEAVFSNPTDFELEGEFILQLPDQAIVTGYSLDIEGHQVEGVIGPTPMVRRAYKDKVRGNIDPGVASVTSRNEFKTEIYPILEQSTRTITVSFVTPHAQGHAFELPLTTSVSDFSLKVNSEQEPRIEVPLITTPTQLVDTPQLAIVEAKNTALEGALIIKTNAKLEPVRSDEPDNLSYWFVPITEDRTATNTIESINIYWDRSLSTAGQAKPMLEFVRALNSESDAKIEIFTFGHDAIEAADINQLDQVTYIGASSYDPIFSAKHATADTCIILSDGHVTIGRVSEQSLPCRLHTITASQGANKAVLAELAWRHSGHAIDLSKSSLSQAVSRVLSPRRSRPSLYVNDNLVTPIPWSFGGRSAYVFPAAQDAEIRVGDQIVASPNEVSSATLSPWWAASRLRALTAGGAPISEQLELARNHSVLGEGMAFVVFEELEDYFVASLPLPDLPKGLTPDEKMEAVALRQELGQLWNQEFETSIDSLRAEWQALKSWYNISFDGLETPPPKRETVRAPRSLSLGEPLSHRDAPGDSMMIEEVIVTASSVAEDSATSELAIEPWVPSADYLRNAAGLCGDSLREKYLELVTEHGTLPAYHLHFGDIAYQCSDYDVATNFYTSALELPVADLETLMAVGYQLMKLKRFALSTTVFQKVANLDEDRPQPLFALARSLIQHGEHVEDHEKKQSLWSSAIDILHRIAFDDWGNRYSGMSLIALVEANGLLERLNYHGMTSTQFDPEWVFPMPSDLRVLLSWHADSVDLDLHVEEPNGERVNFSHTTSTWGGRISDDMIQGYGPEEYLIKKSKDGTYKVFAEQYAGDRLNPNGMTVAEITFFENWGRPNQKTNMVRRELSSENDTLPIGEIKLSRLTAP